MPELSLRCDKKDGAQPDRIRVKLFYIMFMTFK